MELFVKFGLFLLLAGMVIAAVGVLTMEDTPMIPLDASFETTSRVPVPGNPTAILVPCGVIIALVGAVFTAAFCWGK